MIQKAKRWSLWDFLLILFAYFLVAFLFYIFFRKILHNQNLANIITRYIASILLIFLPIYLIKKKYHQTKESLGLCQGKYNIYYYFFLGVSVAIIYWLFLIFVINDSLLVTVNKDAFPYDYKYHFILAPVSLSGFVTIFLVPFGEEIVFRGFLYNVLKIRYNVYLSLAIQGLVFSIIHVGFITLGIDIFIPRLVYGIILGVLYERTNSIYPNIIAHSTYNYLTYLLWVF